MNSSKTRYITAFIAAALAALSFASCGTDSEDIKETEQLVTGFPVKEAETDTANYAAVTGLKTSETSSTTVSDKTSEKESAVSSSDTEKVSASASSVSSSSAVSKQAAHSVNNNPTFNTNSGSSGKPVQNNSDTVTIQYYEQPNEQPSNQEHKLDFPFGPDADEEPENPSEQEKPSDNVKPSEPEVPFEPVIETEEPDPVIPEISEPEIKLNGNSAECNSGNVTVNGSVITVSAEGIYRISGEIEGQIIVNAPKDAQVVLELNGANIHNSNGSAIMIESADKVKISSLSGTSNILSDGGSSVACIYSKDDLTLKGEGTIAINGNAKNAVYSKNTLKITGGNLNITAANNALTGKDKVSVQNGNINITCAKDAIKSTNDTEEGKGIVTVSGGTVTITAGDDAIQAISGVYAAGCSIKVKAEGKKVNCDINVNVEEGCISKIQ